MKSGRNREKKTQKSNDPRKRWRIGNYRDYMRQFLQNGVPARGHPKINDYFDFHRAILKKGVFSKLNFSGCDFSSALFFRANLYESDLSNSDFSKADFCNTSLTKCHLSATKFRNIRARKAVFHECNLSEADFTGADLSCSTLSDCNVNGVDFSFCIMLDIHGLESWRGLPKSMLNTRISPESIEEVRNVELLEMIDREAVLEKYYEYDIAISFAGEDRPLAEEIAEELKSRNTEVFYDAYEEADLWGKNLYEHLTEVYKEKALLCLMLISRNYVKKVWTKLERRAAQARAFSENEEYILPLFIEKVEVPGLLETTGYISLEGRNASDIAKLVSKKLYDMRSSKAVHRTNR